MTWTYSQSKGTMTTQGGAVLATGYAGAPGHVNNAADERLRNLGPLPCGIYTIGAPYHDSKTGIYTLSLTPDPSSGMFGRSEFKIHGDNPRMNQSASEGCIVLPHYARAAIWNSNDHVLSVVS